MIAFSGLELPVPNKNEPDDVGIVLINCNYIYSGENAIAVQT